MSSDPFSIFSSNAHSSKPKKPLIKPNKPAASSPPAHTASKKSFPLDAEIHVMIEKMRKMHDEINRKLDETYQLTGLDPRFIKNYLNNPNNFQTDEWDRVQKERKARLSSVIEHLKAEMRSKSIDSNRIGQKEMQAITKERRSKTLGSRRNWISMR